MPILALLAILLAVPLTLAGTWETLAFRGIPPNQVAFGGDGLEIRVTASAGPVVWPLPQPTLVGRLRVSGMLSGQLNTSSARQGQKGADDFALRVGLVESGTRRPSFVERRLAPAWVRRLFALAPDGEGVGQIRFFNLGLDASQIGWQRVHPLSDLMRETVVAVPESDGRFALDVDTGGLRTLAVWLSADGDDTRSTFTVRVQRIELIAAP